MINDNLKNKKLKDYFYLQKLVLRMTGVSLGENDTDAYKLYSMFCVFLAITYTGVEAYGLVVHINNIDMFANVISLSASHILGVVKVFVLLKNKTSFAKLLNTFEAGIFAPNHQRGGILEDELVEKCISYTTKQSIVYWSAVSMVLFFGILDSVLSKIKSNDYNDWSMPLAPFSLFEVTTNAQFILVCFYQSTCLFIFASIISSIDLLMGSVIAHMKTQFTILKNTIKSIRSDVDDEDFSEKVTARHLQKTSAGLLQKKLKYVVTYHQSIIDLTEQFEDAFNFLLLTLFIGNFLVLCFTMYHASLYPLSNTKAFMDFTYVGAICVQLLLTCYWSNELTLESESVAYACYEVNFVGASPAFQKNLALMIQRSQRPVVLTAGKFVNLSLDAYVSILRMSYSYYMVLRRKNEYK
uniref:Odorant receptor n=1 Tax=Holotrichia parallela TaxID=93412 RepID=A0A2P9JY68_HOLPA|nr:odorant receptor 30 [Holotrichia parallela]